MSLSILDLLILIPILGAVAVFLLPSARVAALGAAAVNAILVGFVAAGFPLAEVTRGFRHYASRPLLDSPELSFAVGIDGMALVMLLLTVIVTLCAVWVSPRTQSPLFYASSLLISAGAIGAFVSTDLVFFYAFHEMALIPTFLMIGIWGYGDRWAAAWKITIYLAVGSVVLLVGLVALYLNLSGEGNLTFDMITLAENAKAGLIEPGTQATIFVTLLIGFGILISLFPFHSWAAPAYAAARRRRRCSMPGC